MKKERDKIHTGPSYNISALVYWLYNIGVLVYWLCNLCVLVYRVYYELTFDSIHFYGLYTKNCCVPVYLAANIFPWLVGSEKATSPLGTHIPIPNVHLQRNLKHIFCTALQ